MKVIYFILSIFIEPYNNYYQSDEIINQYYDILERSNLSKDTKKNSKVKGWNVVTSKVIKDDPSNKDLPEVIKDNKINSINKLNISSKLNLVNSEKGITILNENIPKKNNNEKNESSNQIVQNIQSNIDIDKSVLSMNYKIYKMNNLNKEKLLKESFLMKIFKHLCLFCFNSNREYKFAKNELNKKLDITTFLKEISEISHIKSLALNPYHKELFNHLQKPSIMKEINEEDTFEKTKDDKEMDLIIYFLDRIKSNKLTNEDTYCMLYMKEVMKGFILSLSKTK